MKNDALAWIEDEVNREFDKVVQHRRHIHQNPELSFQEYQTAAYIKQSLPELDFSTVCNTGLVGLINPMDKLGEMQCIALRADIDALPIQEETGLPFSSKNPGVMHACGHDFHASVLMGCARIIAHNRDKLNCQVKFIFQLGEEMLPGGASMMIEAGVLENPKVDEIYGLHVFPDLVTGELGFRSGPYMASSDEIHLEIIGKGGHAALPNTTVDPILVGSHIVVQAQSIVSRHANPTMPSVLSFGHFEALGATNVIPSKAILKGTLRTFDEKWRSECHQILTKLVHNIADTHGATYNLKIMKGYPFLVNDDQTTAKAKRAVEHFFPEDKIIDLPLRMTAEDFSYYSQKVPATFFRVGTRNPNDELNFGLHNSRFSPDEEAMKSAMKALLAIVFAT
jgi:amidohydrolase